MPRWCARAIAVAPICTNCHAPHAVRKGVAESMDTVPCKACHARIFTAYSGSVHGMLRGGGVTAGAAVLQLPWRACRARAFGSAGIEGCLSQLPQGRGDGAQHLAAERRSAFQRGVLHRLPRAERASPGEPGVVQQHDAEGHAGAAGHSRIPKPRRFVDRPRDRAWIRQTLFTLLQDAEPSGRRGQDGDQGPAGGQHRGRGAPDRAQPRRRSAIAPPATAPAPTRSRASWCRSPARPASRSATAPTRTC